MKNLHTKLPQPERQIIARCKKGDTEAFRDIINMYAEYVRSIIFKIILDDEETNDLAQTVFIKIWKNIGKYNAKYTFSTWMYKILINTCYDYLKSAKVRLTEPLDAAPEAQDHSPEDNLVKKDLVKNIKRLSRNLSAKQRMVFILKDLQGLSMDEVCDMLKMNRGTVKSNLYYARKYIKEQLLKMEYKDESYELQRS